MARGKLLVDLGPLRQSQAFRRLWGGYLVTTLGSQLTVVAVPYQVFRLTHSSLDVGLVGLAQIVPVLGGSLFGGSIAGSVIGYAYIKFTHKDASTYELPFGTFLSLAALVAAFGWGLA